MLSSSTAGAAAASAGEAGASDGRAGAGAGRGEGSAAALIQARLFDTVVGCLVGVVGGVCLHSPRFRAVAGGQMRRLMPRR